MSLVVQCPEVGSPTSEAQAWHQAGAPRPFWEVWGLLPAFSRCSVGVVPHVDEFLMYLWGGRWSPCLTPPPSWRSAPRVTFFLLLFLLTMIQILQFLNVCNNVIVCLILLMIHGRDSEFSYLPLKSSHFYSSSSEITGWLPAFGRWVILCVGDLMLCHSF